MSKVSGKDGRVYVNGVLVKDTKQTPEMEVAEQRRKNVIRLHPLTRAVRIQNEMDKEEEL